MRGKDQPQCVWRKVVENQQIRPPQVEKMVSNVY